MSKVEVLQRFFTYNGATFPDPNPDFTVEQVRDLWVGTYPELATAAVEGPHPTERGMEYAFTRAVGAKG